MYFSLVLHNKIIADIGWDFSFFQKIEMHKIFPISALCALSDTSQGSARSDKGMPQTPCKSGETPRGSFSPAVPLPWQMGTEVPPQSTHRSWDTPAWHTRGHPARGQMRMRMRMLRVDSASAGTAALPCQAPALPPGTHGGFSGVKHPLVSPARRGQAARGSAVPPAKPVQPGREGKEKERKGREGKG